MRLHFKIWFCFLTKVHESDTWFFSTSLGADIHKEEQKMYKCPRILSHKWQQNLLSAADRPCDEFKYV